MLWPVQDAAAPEAAGHRRHDVLGRARAAAAATPLVPLAATPNSENTKV